MTTRSAGTYHCLLGVKLDIFWRVDDPVKYHNQFRITKCNDLHELQQWCRSAVFAAATLATAPAAEAEDPPLTVATGWNCHSGSLECAGSAVPEACMHISNADPGPIGDLASANAVQHEDELADFAAEMFGIMPGDDDPSASLNLEGASATVQSAPSISAPTAKRIRSNSFGPESPSQPTVSLACHDSLLRWFKRISMRSLRMQVHCSTASTEDVTQRLQSLELNVSGMHVTLQAHDDKLDRLHGQVCMPTVDSQAKSMLESASLLASLQQLHCCLPEPVLCYQKDIKASFLVHQQHLTIADFMLRHLNLLQLCTLNASFCCFGCRWVSIQRI